MARDRSSSGSEEQDKLKLIVERHRNENHTSYHINRKIVNCSKSTYVKSDRGVISSISRDEDQDASLEMKYSPAEIAEKLYAVPGVVCIYLYRYEIRIDKGKAFEPEAVEAAVRGVIVDIFDLNIEDIDIKIEDVWSNPRGPWYGSAF